METYVLSCLTKNCQINKQPEKNRSADTYHDAVRLGWEHIRKMNHQTIHVTRTTLFILNMRGGMRPVDRPHVDTKTMKKTATVSVSGGRHDRKKRFVGVEA